MAVLGYLVKLKRGLGLAFGGHFLHDFCPLTFIFGQMVRVVFQYDDMWHQRGANL